MGLSASQARLLSITAKISDNELSSQQIANSKVRLADKTQEASDEYIAALNKQKMVFTTYDAKGNSTTQTLTAAFMYEYAPMKNQYVMQDSHGNYLLSAEDIRNYENTDNIMDFLACYGLLSQEKYLRAMDKYNKDMEQYQADLANYEADMRDYERDYNDYLADKAIFDAQLADWMQEKADNDKEWEEWRQEQSKPKLYDEFVGFVGTSSAPNNQAGECYYHALKGSYSCYAHLIAHLLDYAGGRKYSKDEYKTSYVDPNTGEKATTTIVDCSGYMTDDVENDPKWLEFVEAVNDSSRTCDGDDYLKSPGDEAVKENKLQEIIDKGEIPTKQDILLSDYMYDSKNNKVLGVKTLKQKMIDLLYCLNNSNEFPDVDWYETLVNFTDGDLKNLSAPPKEMPPFTEAPPTFNGIEPKKPDLPKEPEYSVELNDQDKAQWYVNLWYMMNGSDTANLVKEDDTTDLKGIFVVNAANKKNGGHYKALEDSLMKSDSWIQFALEHGIVTLVHAEFDNPSLDGGKVLEVTSAGITWTSTVWSNCVDISSVDDEVARAKAEAQYTKKLNKIEAKDKKYDNDIKKLDTEHNALQTEYESIKEVINKNIERSFKAFS